MCTAVTAAAWGPFVADDEETPPTKPETPFGWPAAVTTMFVVLCLLVCTLGRMNALPWK